MGLASLIDERNLSGGDFGIDYTPSSFIDVTKSAFNATIDNYLTTSARSLQNEQIDNQYNLIQQIEKQSLEQIIGEDVYNSDDRYKKTDEWIESKRQQDALYQLIPTTSEMRLAAEKKAKDSFLDLEKVKKGASGVESFFGELAGGLGASVFDPVNIAVTVGSLGSGALLNSSRIATQTAGRIIATEAAIGAGTEVVMQPFVTGWQQQVGNDYGLGDAVTNIAFAGLVSGGIAGITSGALKKGIQATRDKGSVFFETIATSDRTPEQFKPIMEKMADYARVKETNPFDGVQGSKVHADNVKLAEDAFNKREAFEPQAGRVNAETFEPQINDIFAGREERLKNWFGDSKVVNAEGKPLVVYHGTISDIQSFDINKLGTNTKALSAKQGFFFTDKPSVAGQYAELAAERNDLWDKVQILERQGKFEEAEELTLRLEGGNIDANENIIPVYINIKNPLVVDFKNKTYDANVDNLSEHIKKAKENNNDGVIFKNLDDSVYRDRAEVSDHYVAFSPNQVKSIFDQSFDPESPNIFDRFEGQNLSTPEEEYLPRDYRAIESPDDELINTVQRVERNEFEDLINEDPDFTVTMDDGTKVKISDIMNDVIMNEKINDAIKVCSI